MVRSGVLSVSPWCFVETMRCITRSCTPAEALRILTLEICRAQDVVAQAMLGGRLLFPAYPPTWAEFATAFQNHQATSMLALLDSTKSLAYMEVWLRGACACRGPAEHLANFGSRTAFSLCLMFALDLIPPAPALRYLLQRRMVVLRGCIQSLDLVCPSHSSLGLLMAVSDVVRSSARFRCFPPRSPDHRLY